MQTIQPNLVAALVAMSVGTLMVRAGIAKKQLAWRPRRAHRWGRRRP